MDEHIKVQIIHLKGSLRNIGGFFICSHTIATNNALNAIWS